LAREWLRRMLGSYVDAVPTRKAPPYLLSISTEIESPDSVVAHSHPKHHWKTLLVLPLRSKDIEVQTILAHAVLSPDVRDPFHGYRKLQARRGPLLSKYGIVGVGVHFWVREAERTHGGFGEGNAQIGIVADLRAVRAHDSDTAV
jgi:hypothetical protein